ncbi:MAG TPA: LysM peptidoglycan-binding domain-containing protein [Chloroflexia bacterium]|nr:LysM peptidoglycan-binding domain-containing protein [Chloroflexia bacterium]
MTFTTTQVLDTSHNPYSIQAGDTIVDIASAFNTSVGRICNDPANQDILATISLTTSDQITLPDGTIHNVKAGETLQLIAEQAGTSPGAILDVPINSDIVGKIDLSKVNSGFVTVPTPEVYTVQAGDTIRKLAQDKHTSVGAICALAINSDVVALVDLASIKQIYVHFNTPYLVKPGDTLAGIAAANATTVGTILNRPQNAALIDTIDLSKLASRQITLPAPGLDVSQPVQNGMVVQAKGGASTPLSSSSPVKVNGVYTSENRRYYMNPTRPSHSLPQNFLSRFPGKDTVINGWHSRYFTFPGECAWYAANVLHHCLNNDIADNPKDPWAGVTGTVQGQTTYKGDAKNWPKLCQPYIGTGVQAVNKTPSVGCMVTWQQGIYGHISVVEDVQAGIDSAGNRVVLVSVSEYNYNNDEMPQYRDIVYPADSQGTPIIPDGTDFLHFTPNWKP